MSEVDDLVPARDERGFVDRLGDVQRVVADNRVLFTSIIADLQAIAWEMLQDGTEGADADVMVAFVAGSALMSAGSPSAPSPRQARPPAA